MQLRGWGDGSQIIAFPHNIQDRCGVGGNVLSRVISAGVSIRVLEFHDIIGGPFYTFLGCVVALVRVFLVLGAVVLVMRGIVPFIDFRGLLALWGLDLVETRLGLQHGIGLGLVTVFGRGTSGGIGLLAPTLGEENE